MLALPMSEGALKATARAVVALPNTQAHQMSTSTKDIDNRSTKMQVDADTQPRDYNELMDQYSLHQIIIRKGEILDTTPEFVSFKRTHLNKWGSVAFILHQIQKLVQDSEIDMAYIEGRKVAMLAGAEMDLKKPSKEDLYDCINNKDEVASRIDMLGDLVDIDGNGTVDALTDGLVILRYLFNLRGDVLINDVIASDATVKTAEDVEAKIEQLIPAL